MAIQIVNDQIVAQAVTSDKINNGTISSTQMAMGGSFNFTGTLQSAGATVATQAYVDSAVAGLHWKESVKCASTAQITAAYANGSSGVGATLTAGSNGAIALDGISPLANDRVLIRHSVSDAVGAAANGIYTVTTVGDGSNPFVLTRATDCDTVAEFKSAAVFVREGSGLLNKDIAFVQTADSVTIGTTAIVFSAFSGTEALIAGVGIAKTANTISLDMDELTDTAMTVSADSIPFIDASGNSRKDSFVDVVSGMAGTGLTAGSGQLSLQNNALSVATGDGIDGGGSIALGASRTINLDLNGLAAATVDVANDSIAIIDASASNANKKESIVDLVAGMAGSGLTAGSGQLALTASAITITAGNGLSGGGSAALGGSASLALDFNELSAGSPDDLANDLLCMIDATDGSSKKMTFVNYATGIAGSGLTATDGILALTNSSVTVNAGTGLSGGGAISLGANTTLAVDLNEFSTQSVDVANDAIVFIDASDSNASKKQTIASIATAMAGTGLNGTSGQLLIAPNGVGANELANNAVDTAAIADNAVSIAKIGARPYTEAFTGTNALQYDLARTVAANWDGGIRVYRNGQRQKPVGSPSDNSEYSISLTGGTGGVTRITFGGNSGDLNSQSIIVDYMT